MSMIHRPTKLDIGCGSRKHEGFIGIDIAAIPGVDIIHDLDIFPWPIEDGCVEDAIADHYIEHTKDLIVFMNELYRVMRVGATATIVSPFYNSIRAWQDPTTTRIISEQTFVYFNKGWRRQTNIEHYPITCDFDSTGQYILFEKWQNKSQQELQFAIQHYTNVVSDVKVTLIKR
jgi:hypothetical protein